MISQKLINDCKININTSKIINTIAKTIAKTIANKLKFIDLFCGIGGFHTALKRVNAECVFACDIDNKCREVYYKNYNIKPEGDITKINIDSIPQFDILCGGFPCQSFSNSGNKKGFNDKRGQLFEYILKIAIVKKPSFMFLENVKHIKKMDNGNIFKHIINRIEQSGYNVQTIELSPHQLGIPQQRERVIFICIRNDIYINPIDFIIPYKQINVNSIFETDKKITEQYRISEQDEQVLIAWDKMIKVFETGENLSPTILCNEFNNNYTSEQFKKLPAWKQDYITKNKYIFNKYKTKWDQWIENNKEILKKKEIYGKLEWQTGKKKTK